MKQIHPIKKYFLTLWSMIRSNIRDYGMYIAFIVIAIAFSAITGGLFLQPRNFSNLLDQTAYVAVLAVGMTLVIVTRMIDLSVGYLGAFMGAYVVVSVEVNGQSIGVALLGALAIAIVVGIAKGFAVAKLHVPAFVVTLAGMFIFKGLLMLETNTRTIPTANPFFNRIGIEYLTGKMWGPFDAAMIIFGAIVALYLIIRYGNKKSSVADSRVKIEVKETVSFLTIVKNLAKSVLDYIVYFITFKWLKHVKAIMKFLQRSFVILCVVGVITLAIAYIVVHPLEVGGIGIYGLIFEILIIIGVLYLLYNNYLKKEEPKERFGSMIIKPLGKVLAYATIIGGLVIEFNQPKPDSKPKKLDRILNVLIFIAKVIGSIVSVAFVLGFSIITGWIGREIEAGNINLLTVEVGAILLAAVLFNFIRGRNKKRKIGLKLEGMPIFLTKLFIMVGIIIWLTYTLAAFRGISYLLLITIIVVIVYVFLTTQTVIGRRVFAVGGNPEAAELSGISVTKIIIFVMVSMGILALVSGVMYVTRTQNTSPNHGPFWELYAIAAAFIGGTSAEGGSGKIVNSVIGAVVIMSLKNGMALAGFDSNIEPVVLGSVLLLAVVFDIYTRNVRTVDMVGVYLAKVDNKDRIAEAKRAYKKTRKELRQARKASTENLIDYEYRYMNAEGQLKRIKDMIRSSKEEDFT